MAVREDVWLTDVLGYPVFAVDGASGVPQQEGRALFYSKVDTADVTTLIERLHAGFAVVDVNVTFERNGGSAVAVDERIEVRPAANAEFEALIGIAGRCFRYSRFHLDPDVAPAAADRVKSEWVRSYTERRRGLELLVALDRDEPVGFLAVLEARDARVIDLVGVAPERHGQGFGRALVSHFVGRHAAAARLRVGTQIANTPSLRLYASAGFAIAGSSYVLHRHTWS